MKEKVMKGGIKKQKGYKYFIDDQGDISRYKGQKHEKVMKCGIRKQDGYFYFIDNQGDIDRVLEKDIDKNPNLVEEFSEEKEELLKRKKMRIEAEERKRLEEQQLRYEIRKKLLEEEFKDLPKDSRLKIPEEVRHEVWRRDEGKCAKCGNQENLEFDHIIPLSKGGSNTARNIELLCEKCNRQKSNNI